MKRTILLLAMCFFGSICSFAQEEEDGTMEIAPDTVVAQQRSASSEKAVKFFKSLKYEIIGGFNVSTATEPFDAREKIGFDFGLATRGTIASYLDDSLDFYGTVGLGLTSRGGWQTNSADEMFDSGQRLTMYAVALPIHVGVEYKFTNVSLFFDLGPNLLFKVSDNFPDFMSESDVDESKINSFALSGSLNFGLRWKRFAFGFGFEKDFTDVAEINDSNVRCSVAHVDFRWTIGRDK